jgi:hypothetical protein
MNQGLRINRLAWALAVLILASSLVTFISILRGTNTNPILTAFAAFYLATVVVVILTLGFHTDRRFLLQLRLWRKRWMGNLSIFVLVALAVLVIAAVIGLGYWLRWSWTGFVVIEDKDPASPMRVEVVNDPKLLWDWLELLIIPIVLGAGALWFNNQTRKSEQAIAQDRTREEALQRYLDTMQG